MVDLVVSTAEQVQEKILAKRPLSRRRQRAGCPRGGRRFADGKREAAALEHERLALAVLEVQNLAHEDHMIAALVLKGGSTLETRRATVE